MDNVLHLINPTKMLFDGKFTKCIFEIFRGHGLHIKDINILLSEALVILTSYWEWLLCFYNNDTRTEIGWLNHTFLT